MFLGTGSVLRKKGSGRPTKRTAENTEEVEQRIAETPNFIHPEISPRNLPIIWCSSACP
jgi:hypothetical protein